MDIALSLHLFFWIGTSTPAPSSKHGGFFLSRERLQDKGDAVSRDLCKQKASHKQRTDIQTNAQMNGKGKGVSGYVRNDA